MGSGLTSSEPILTMPTISEPQINFVAIASGKTAQLEANWKIPKSESKYITVMGKDARGKDLNMINRLTGWAFLPIML